MGEIKKVRKKNVKMGNFSVKELRQRLFVQRGTKIYPNREYTYLDNVPKQIEKLEGFTNWETFSENWDILWVGLDPRTLQWVPGRHNSPMRALVTPIRIVLLDERTKRMEVSFEDRPDIAKIPVPFDKPLPESEEDRIISESLSGKVIVDEPDEDKAIRMIEANLKMLQDQLLALKK